MRHYVFKVGTALILSLVWTFLIAYLLSGKFIYRLDHLILDLTYSFVMFYLFYEGYIQIMVFLSKRYPALQMSAEKYLIGLLIFEIYSLAIFVLIGVIPFYLIMGALSNNMSDAAAIRLNFIMLVLMSAIYYGILTSFLVFKNIHQASLQAEKLQKEIAQAQFESLKNQVNPHFLFNSLNVLTSLISIDPLLAEKFTEQLSKAYRYVLEHKGDDLVLLKTELEFIYSYIFLIDIRFKDKLKVNINLPEEKLTWLLPPLTLQLLIENAIKHNVLSRKSPLQIEIFVDKDNYLCVRNNLQIREEAMASSKVGLQNISNRYSYITDQPTYFGVEGKDYVTKIPLLQ